MGATECCKVNKEGETELKSGKSNDRLFNQSIDDPQELDKRFERLIEVFPFALNRVVVQLYANPVHRKSAISLAPFLSRDVRALPNTTWS
jgi:hypothetical protein